MKNVTLINYTGSKGGGAQYTYELTDALITKGLPVVAVISSYNEDLQAWKQLNLEKLIIIDTYLSPRQLVTNSIFWNKKSRYIKKELADYKVERIIVPMITFWTKRINQLFPAAKKLVVLHDPIAHSGDKNKLALQLFGETSTLKNADNIIVLSSMYIDYVERKYDKKNKVVQIPMGTTNLYKNLDNQIKTVIYDQNKVNFLFFGTISKYKGIEILAQAYKTISEKLDNVTLTIAGSGDFSGYEKQYIGLPNVNVYNRWIANEEVESFFDGDTVVAVLPYLDATQSGVFSVCVSYGVPIIASDAGGIREQVESYGTGILVEKGDSKHLAEVMLELASNKEEIVKQKEKSIKNAENFSWFSIAEQMMKLF